MEIDTKKQCFPGRNFLIKRPTRFDTDVFRAPEIYTFQGTDIFHLGKRKDHRLTGAFKSGIC